MHGPAGQMAGTPVARRSHALERPVGCITCRGRNERGKRGDRARLASPMGRGRDRPPSPQHHSSRKVDTPLETVSHVTAIPDAGRHCQSCYGIITRNNSLGTVRYAIDSRLRGLCTPETQFHVERRRHTPSGTSTVDREPTLDPLRQVIVGTRALCRCARARILTPTPPYAAAAEHAHVPAPVSVTGQAAGKIRARRTRERKGSRGGTERAGGRDERQADSCRLAAPLFTTAERGPAASAAVGRRPSPPSPPTTAVASRRAPAPPTSTSTPADATRAAADSELAVVPRAGAVHVSGGPRVRSARGRGVLRPAVLQAVPR